MKFDKKQKFIVGLPLLFVSIIGMLFVFKFKDENKTFNPIGNIGNTNLVSESNEMDNDIEKIERLEQQTAERVSNPVDIDIQDIEFENESESVNVFIHDELVEPGEGTLDVDKIAGFIPDDKYNDKESTDNVVEGIKLSVDNITADAVGGYTGNYVEDGSDAPIKNVASLVITNHSDSMLQVADIEFIVNDNDIAKFRVTNLLPGTSVLVLESSKLEYKETDNYSYGTVATAWIESVSLQEDKFYIDKEDGLLTLKNNTDKTYGKVYVYYKYIQVGGAYMGGITYRVPFVNVAPNAKIESVANHFNKRTSKIVDVQIVE